MQDKKKNIILRYLGICVFALVLFGIIIARIIQIQTKEYDRWMVEASKQKKTDVEVPPNRGNIYACDGRLMASSLPTYIIYMDPCTDWLMKDSSKNFYRYIDTLALEMHDIMPDNSAEYYKNLITNAHTNGIRTLRLHKAPITFKQMEKLREIRPFRFGRNKGGLTWTEQKKRKQPFGSLARRTLGSTYATTNEKEGTIEGNGSSGLELYYNNLLKGEPGKSIRQRVASKDEYEIVQPPVNGCDIYTTLDIDLLDITEYALHKQLNYSQADWGCAVLMETATGNIRAITNLKRASDGTYYEGENYAAQAFEPGSTFKTLSLMAALDDNIVDLGDSIKTGNGTWVYQDPKQPIHDTHSWGTISAKQALTVSSNVALAKIITEGYKHDVKKYVNKLLSMGLTQPIEIAIPGAHEVSINIPNDKETMAHMAFGYSVEIPPIYMLAYYNAIANGGQMVEPKLVEEIRQGNKTIKKYDTKILESQICKKSTLSDIRECLESVVWDQNGTARAAQSDTVKIAGKTGTARVFKNGKYQAYHRITFCGFFPYDNPQYTCICVIENPKHGGAGSLCGKIVKEIAEHTMAIKGIVPLDSIMADPNLSPRIKAGNRKATRKATRKLSISTTGLSNDSSDWVRISSNMHAQNIEYNRYFVPNVIGMGAKDAIYLIETTGMKVRIKGQGQVVKQSVQAGKPAQVGGTVYLELR